MEFSIFTFFSFGIHFILFILHIYKITFEYFVFINADCRYVYKTNHLLSIMMIM